MISILQLAALSFITVFAAAAAVAFNWLLLRTMFALMRPATMRRPPASLQVIPGTTQLTRAYATRR